MGVISVFGKIFHLKGIKSAGELSDSLFGAEESDAAPCRSLKSYVLNSNCSDSIELEDVIRGAETPIENSFEFSLADVNATQNYYEEMKKYHEGLIKQLQEKLDSEFDDLLQAFECGERPTVMDAYKLTHCDDIRAVALCFGEVCAQWALQQDNALETLYVVYSDSCCVDFNVALSVLESAIVHRMADGLGV